MSLRHRAFLFPPSGLTFLNSICKNLRGISFVEGMLMLVRPVLSHGRGYPGRRTITLSYSKSIRTWYHSPKQAISNIISARLLYRDIQNGEFSFHLLIGGSVTQ